MRRIFIGFGLIVFFVYCWASVAYQNQVDVPGYKLVELDVLGGKSRAVWDADKSVQFQRLMELENRNYQTPDNAHGIPPGRPLTSVDFAGLVAKAPAQGPVMVKLLDTSALYGLLAHNYLLRDSIPDPADPDGQPLYVGGRPLDKEMLDDLRGRGIGVITITGHGAPVNFMPGTAVMVAVIFLTLVAALKPVVWDPFLAMLERRGRELEIGAEAERQNQLEAVRFEEERRRRVAEFNREMQRLRMAGQRENAKVAGEVVAAARNEERKIKLEGLGAIRRSAAEAEAAMEQRVPELAEAIAEALTPGRPRG